MLSGAIWAGHLFSTGLVEAHNWLAVCTLLSVQLPDKDAYLLSNTTASQLSCNGRDFPFAGHITGGYYFDVPSGGQRHHCQA
jgi:hypothetical protein